MTAAMQAASGTGLPLNPSLSLQRVLQDISASLEDLQTVVKEAGSHGEIDRGMAEPTSGANFKDYPDLFDLAPDAYLVTDTQTIIAAGNQAAAAILKVNRDALPGTP